MSAFSSVCYEQRPGASEYTRTPPMPGSIEAIDNNQLSAYCTLANTIGITAVDIPLSEIHTYFDALDLSPPPLILFDATTESLSQIQAVSPSTARAFRIPNYGGMYASDINVALVASNRLTTGTHKVGRVVHELGHGTSLNAFRIVRTSATSFEYYTSRSGYMVEAPNDMGTRNNLLDEGRAEMLAGQFIAWQQPVRKDTEPLYRDGLWIPSSYIHSHSEADYALCDASSAAVAVELLIAKAPNLLRTIIQGSTSLRGLRQTAQEMNNLAPRLYSELSRAPREEAPFSTAAKAIVDAFYGGDKEAPLWAHKYVADLMHEELGDA